MRSAIEIFFTIGLSAVEIGLHFFKNGQNFSEFLGLVHSPVFLRCETDTGSIGSAAVVASTEGRCGCPGGRNQLRCRQPGFKQSGFEGLNVAVIDQCVINRRNGVLPEKLFFGNVRPEVSGKGAHVAMSQLIPGLGESVGKLVGVLEKPLGDFGVGRIFFESQISGVHDGRVGFAFDVSIGDCSGGCAVFWNPHFSTGRGGFQFPVVGIEIHEILMRPLSRSAGPGSFESTGSGVFRVATTD